MRTGLTLLALLAPMAVQAGTLPRVITPEGTQSVPALVPVAPAVAAIAASASLGLQHSLVPPGPGLRPALLKQVLDEAAKQGVPPDLADAVAVVETGYTPGAIGTSGEIGLMQVMPGTAVGLGFHGTMTELADPATNIHYGVAYLAKAWAAADGNPCRALMKYRAGVGEEGYSPLSLQYCRHAATWLATAQSALADKVAGTTPAIADIADRSGAGLWSGGSAGGEIDLHELPALAGQPNMVVEGGSRARRHGAPGVDLAAVQAAVDAAVGGGTGDGHVVRMPQ